MLKVVKRITLESKEFNGSRWMLGSIFTYIISFISDNFILYTCIPQPNRSDPVSLNYLSDILITTVKHIDVYNLEAKYLKLVGELVIYLSNKDVELSVKVG